MTIIKFALDDFVGQMVNEFIRHNDKFAHDFDLYGVAEQLKDIDPEYLRRELTYHFAKWIYSSVDHHDRPEADTLINLVNVCFLLWFQVR